MPKKMSIVIHHAVKNTPPDANIYPPLTKTILIFLGIWRGCFFYSVVFHFFLINHVESTSRSSKRKGGENPPPPPQQYPNSKQEL